MNNNTVDSHWVLFKRHYWAVIIKLCIIMCWINKHARSITVGMGCSEKKWINTLCEIQSVHVITIQFWQDFLRAEDRFTEHSSPTLIMIEKIIGGYEITAPVFILCMREWTFSRKIAIRWTSTVKAFNRWLFLERCVEVHRGHPVENALTE